MRRLLALLAVLAAFALGAVALAQDAGEDEGEGGLIAGLVQDALSAPGREVRLRGIEGALRSRARIAEITVSDREGVWLRVENAVIDWSWAQILLRRVNVNELRAERIEYIRPALPPEQAVTREVVEAEPFSLPELPVAVRLQTLEIGTLAFGESVFGQAAELGVTGSLTLVEGELDTALLVARQDAPGGELSLQASYSNASQELALDLVLAEPEGGIVATVLNLEGRPPVELTLQGAGPLGALDVDFAFDAGGERIAGGLVSLRQEEAGLAFSADFEGALSPLVPETYREFFAGTSEVVVAGVSKAEGGVRIDQLAIDGAELTLAGSAETGPDFFPTDIDLSGSLGDPDGEGVLLPVPGGDTRLNSATLEITYGEGDRWTGLVALDRLVAGDVTIEDLTLTLGGLAENLNDPAARNVTITAEGLASGVSAADPDVQQALGSRIDLFADVAIPPGAPVEIRQFQFGGQSGLSVFTAGTIADGVYSGRSSVRIADIGAFSGLAGRDLSGGLNLRATGDVLLTSGGFDLGLEGMASDVAVGDPRLDALLAGQTELAGRVARDENGIRTEDFRIANPQVEFASNGRVTALATDIAFTARLADLALVTEGASGAVEASGRARGLAGPVRVEVRAAIPQGSVSGRALTGAEVGFRGNVVDSNVVGTLTGEGALDGLEMTLGGEVGLVGTTRSLRDFALVVGPNRIAGSLFQQGEGVALGQLTVEAPEIAPLAALALVEASGSVGAEVTLREGEIGQGADIRATVADLAAGETRVASLSLDARVEDALGVPLVNGNLSAEGVAAGGIVAETLTAEAEQLDAERMRFSAETRLDIGTGAALQGELARLDGGFAATLERLVLTQEEVSARLVAPATVTLRGGEVALTPLALDFGDGRLEAEGTVGETLDLRVLLQDLPLDIANAVQPDLALTGRVDGEAVVGGTSEAPEIRFDIDGSRIGAAALAGSGLPPLDVTASGATEGGQLDFEAALTAEEGLQARAEGVVPIAADAGPIAVEVDIGTLPLAIFDPLAGNQGLAGTVQGTATVAGSLEAPEIAFDVTGTGLATRLLAERGVPPITLDAEGQTEAQRLVLDASLTAAGGLAAQAAGAVPLGAEAGPLDLDVTLEALPLALLDGLAGGQGLGGTVTGTATVGGELTDPQARFDITGSGLTARPAAELGLPPLSAGVAGSYAGEVLVLDTLSASGGGLDLSGGGRVPISGPGIDLSVSGTAPLALANTALADREAQLSGTVGIDLAVGGSLAAPSFAGTVGVDGATLVDPQSNLRLEGIALDARLTGDAVTIDSLTARSAAGGGIAASGTIGLGDGFPADLAITLDALRYSDGTFVTTEVSGALTLTGPVTGDGTLAGQLALGETEISVAEGLGARAGVELEEVEHVVPPPPVQETLARARVERGAEAAAAAAGGGLGLDVRVSAPNRIFIRGRGLDAELGGELVVRGTTNDVQPVGQFDLIRGRLSILGQRIEFEEGSLQLTGTLDPTVFLVARTESEGITAFVTVSGPVSELDITFSSEPELPQDEVLARILFDRGAQDLSAFQLAQLAAAAAELAGGGGNGLLAQLRSGTGLDDLDIITEDSGATAVRAGRYIEDNIYLDVQASSEGTTRATINLDITDQITARGSVASDGNTSVGVYYERDY